MIDQTADIMLLEKMFSKPRIARYARGVKSDVIPENNKTMPHKKTRIAAGFSFTGSTLS